MAKHYQGQVDDAERLCMVATFAVGLPYFVYKRPATCPGEAEPLTALVAA